MRLAIPDLISNSYFPAIAAVELGHFAAEGVDMQLELVFPVTRAMQALHDGEFDFVVGAAHATLAGFPEWQGASLLAAAAQRMYWFLVMRADLHAARGDLSVLKGRRIGAAPGPDAGLVRLLREAGIEPERDGVQIGPVPGSDQPSVSFGVTAAQALADGKLDGFWANGMGAEVAVRRGAGTVVIDTRRGDGPPPSWQYTFPALVTTERLIADNPAVVTGAIRGLIRAQSALKADLEVATTVGQRVFPPMEAGLIAELIRRDLPYYDPAISVESVGALNRFARDMHFLSGEVAYDRVVATQFAHLWKDQPSAESRA
ncbi:MAG: ABC transporter substrate-binding protein [Chloroflexi bacterium]|nr:ABC transporter substrate-binding protein [Chloroflexota bacterium]MBV9600857.1 ABC transporter substrate-binding protein [Chloroflexota bacterium]